MRTATSCPRPLLGKLLHNPRTGDSLPVPCGTWGCSVCGPAKAHRLGLLAAAAEPERFVTLSRVGPDLQTVHRRLQILSRALRRSGWGWEYLAVPEVHRNGSWHLHLLQRGDFIPQRKLSERARSAGMGYVVDIRRIQAAGDVAPYLCKYLTKQTLNTAVEASKHRRRFRTSRNFWPGGREACELKAFGPRWSSWSIERDGAFSCS